MKEIWQWLRVQRKCETACYIMVLSHLSLLGVIVCSTILSILNLPSAVPQKVLHLYTIENKIGLVIRSELYWCFMLEWFFLTTIVAYFLFSYTRTVQYISILDSTSRFQVDLLTVRWLGLKDSWKEMVFSPILGKDFFRFVLDF